MRALPSAPTSMRKPTKKKTRRGKKKFEDPKDPERSRAKEDGIIVPIKEGRRVVGRCHSWYLEDKEHAVNVVQWDDGSLAAYIESFETADDE